MNRIEEIFELPSLEWGPHTRHEMERGSFFEPTAVLHRMYQFVGDEPLMVLGVIHTSATAIPWLWLAVTQAFYAQPIANIRSLFRLQELLPSPLRTLIEDGFQEGVLFAEAFGFKPTGNFMTGYEIYRRG